MNTTVSSQIQIDKKNIYCFVQLNYRWKQGAMLVYLAKIAKSGVGSAWVMNVTT